MIKNISASVREKLLNVAKAQKLNYDQILKNYVIERYLYRLGVSQYKNAFLLKGSWLLYHWTKSFNRPTKDVDFLSYESNNPADLTNTIKEISMIKVDDGLVFIKSSFKSEVINKEGTYKGVRVIGHAKLATAKIKLQLDIGFGDAVIPKPKQETLPTILDQQAPKILVYSVYSVISEKFHAMVDLGIRNTRMKDFYDIYLIGQTLEIDGRKLAKAIKATFDRRDTPFTTKPLFVFSAELMNDASKELQWSAFINKNNLQFEESFIQVNEKLKIFLMPAYTSIVKKSNTPKQWRSSKWRWE